MAGITELLNYNTPYTREEYRQTPRSGFSNALWNSRMGQQRTVVETGGGATEGMGEDPLDALLKGYDAESKALTQTLKNIYDNYTGVVGEYGDEMTPIFDQIEGDIDKFYDYMGGYKELLGEIKPDFMNSIITDPNASRTRNEYMGNVASQYEQAEGAMRRDAAQQGINPYENTGATRDFNLSRAADLAGTANQAYGDWREGYNRDIQAQQQADATYAGLFNKQGDQYGDLLNARSGLATMRKDIYDTRLDAEKAKAAGYEGLAGLVENRRTQALNLGQAKASADASAAGQALQAKAAMPGQQWYDPNFNAGGSRTWS